MIFVVSAFAIGAIIAGGSVGYILIHRQTAQQTFLDYEFQCQPEMSSALVCLHALRQLRLEQSSSSNTIEYLETRLDNSVAGIGKYVEYLPLADRESFPAVTNVLRAAKEYRARFPHTNQDLVIQAGIENAFSLVNEKPKH